MPDVTSGPVRENAIVFDLQLKHFALKRSDEIKKKTVVARRVISHVVNSTRVVINGIQRDIVVDSYRARNALIDNARCICIIRRTHTSTHTCCYPHGVVCVCVRA